MSIRIRSLWFASAIAGIEGNYFPERDSRLLAAHYFVADSISFETKGVVHTKDSQISADSSEVFHGSRVGLEAFS